jgi:hypothetical protein
MRRVGAVLAGATIGVVLPFLPAVPATAAPPDAEAGTPACFMTLSGATVGSFPCVTWFPDNGDAAPDSVVIFDSWGPDARRPGRVNVTLIVSSTMGAYGYAKVMSADGVEWIATPPSLGRFTFKRSKGMHGTLDATLPVSNLPVRFSGTPPVELHVVF